MVLTGGCSTIPIFVYMQHLLWSISDFSAETMTSGWKRKRLMACLYCQDEILVSLFVLIIVFVIWDIDIFYQFIGSGTWWALLMVVNNTGRQSIHLLALKFMNRWKDWKWYIETLKENRAMWEGCELEKEEHIFCFTLSQDAFVATQRLCHASKEEYLRYVARHFTRYQRETKDKLV